MERIIRFRPAFDKRNPDPRYDYGVHGVEVMFVLKGPAGATHFILFTNWHLPHVQRELDAKRTDHLLCHCQPADVGYHSPTPMFEDQRPSSQSCEWLDGRPCYSDGSGLYSEKVYERLVREGDAAVWSELEEWYKERLDCDPAVEA